jgi:hypothetical protein
MGLVSRQFVLILLSVAVGMQTAALPRGGMTGVQAGQIQAAGAGGGGLEPPIKMPAEPSERRSFCAALRDSGVTSLEAASAKGKRHAVDWREYDCSFWLSRDDVGNAIGPHDYKYLPYRGLLARMRALVMLYPDKVLIQSHQLNAPGSKLESLNPKILHPAHPGRALCTLLCAKQGICDYPKNQGPRP